MKPYIINNELIYSNTPPEGYTVAGTPFGLVTNEQAQAWKDAKAASLPKWDEWRLGIISMPAYSRVASNAALSPVLALSIQFERWSEAAAVWNLLVQANPLTTEEIATFNSISNVNNVSITLNSNGTMDITNL